jgi:hypothetical protein
MGSIDSERMWNRQDGGRWDEGQGIPQEDRAPLVPPQSTDEDWDNSRHSLPRGPNSRFTPEVRDEKGEIVRSKRIITSTPYGSITTFPHKEKSYQDDLQASDHINETEGEQ